MMQESDKRIDQMYSKWWVLIAIGIGTFMSALDGSVVNTILPVLRQSFSSNVAEIEWVVTIYLLVLSGLLLSFGRLGDIRGHKNVYIAGFGVFVFSSAFCAFAPSVQTLVVFRAIQALGAAMLQANSPAILTSTFPARQRGQALGLQAAMTYLGLTVGPSLGGWLADQFSWRAVFFINIPVGLIAFWMSYRFIQPDQKADKQEKFDLRGAALFMSSLVLLIYGLNQGHSIGWNSWLIIGSLLSSFAILALFVLVERNHQKPMLDMSLFGNRVFSASVASAVLNYIGVYSIVFLMPFFLIQGIGLSASRAGLILTSMPIIMAISAPISGSLSDRFGTRAPATIGMSVLTLGLLLLAGLNINSSILEISIKLGVAGFGIGTFISPNTSALMGAAPPHRQGIASGILATSRNVGMVLGVGLAGAVFTTVLGSHSQPSAAGVIAGVNASFLAAASFCASGTFIAAFFSTRERPTLVQPSVTERK